MEQSFYLRDSRSNVGSSAMFWASGGGYTSDLDEAEKFTRDKAVDQHNSRETDIPVRCDLADSHSYPAVDMQLLPEPSICEGLNYLVWKGVYDGNNIKFCQRDSHSFSLAAVVPVAREYAQEQIERYGGGIVSYPYEAIKAIARPAVNAAFIPTKFVLKEARIKMNPRLRPKRQTSGQHRFNCPTCARFVWSHNPYEPGYCKNCRV